MFHNYVIRVSPEYRDEIMYLLQELGIETKIHYPIPLHLQKCASNLGYKKGDIPKVEYYANSMISLPIFPFLKDIEVEYIIENLNNVIGKILK